MRIELNRLNRGQIPHSARCDSTGTIFDYVNNHLTEAVQQKVRIATPGKTLPADIAVNLAEFCPHFEGGECHLRESASCNG